MRKKLEIKTLMGGFVVHRICLGKILTRLPFPCELFFVHVYEFTGASPDMEFSKQKYQPLYKFLQ